MKPQFITFTGVDEKTDIDRMVDLSERFPIEWGLLFSKNRQALDPRYPSISVMEKVFPRGLRLAAHLCGRYAHDIMSGDFSRSDLPLEHFSRIQVNHAKPEPERIRAIAVEGQPIIAQWRDPDLFPTADEGVQWLYDLSGGNGIAPDHWPANTTDRMVGFAGGINPTNAVAVKQIVSEKSPAGYWLDMESGVRTDGYLDLNLVEKVCLAVYS